MVEDKKDNILSIRGMSKSFGRNRVLDHINLDVKKGSIMGLMGENGAGKSTMMKCLFGTYQKDEGTIILDGKEINFSGPKDALENGIALVHQELNQCLERNVVDNLFLGRYPVNSLGMIDEGRMKKEASELFRKLGMTVNLEQPMRNMSVSQRQMCEIAKAISRCDELLLATIDKNSEKVAEIIELAHDTYTSVLKYNDENSLSCVLTMAYFTAPAYYNIIREMPAGKGFADFVFIPRANAGKKPAMVIELKYDSNADSAINQIKENKYQGALSNYFDKILLVGINYDSKGKAKKHHSCIIEEWYNT